MRRLCLLLVACKLPAPPQALPEDVRSDEIAPDITIAALPRPAPAPIPALRGPSGEIGQLAITDDGAAVLSADITGGLRLWPTLDGGIEPIMIGAPSPISIALARDGDGFAIAVLDTPGALTIIHVAANGDQTSRTQVADDVAFVAVHATSLGIVAVRSDHALVAFDLRGARIGALVPPPGERVAAVLSRGDGAPLVLVRAASYVRGRWIASGFTWGAPTPPLHLDLGSAVLSPNHEHLAATWHGRAVEIDLVTGATQTISTGLVPLGYAAPRLLAGEREDKLEWWQDGKEVGMIEASGLQIGFAHRSEIVTDLAHSPIAVGDGLAVVAAMAQLQLIDRDRARYLGYQMPFIETVVQAPAGVIVSAWQSTIDLAVDGNLGTRATYHRDHEEVTIAIDARRLLVSGYDQKAGHYFVALRDGDTEIDRVTLYGNDYGTIAYEPSTRLLSIDLGESKPIELYRLGTRPSARLEYVAEVNLNEREPHTVYLTDPARAHGTAVIVAALALAHEVAPRTVVPAVAKVIEIREADIGSFEEQHVAWRKLAGNIKAVDRAGHYYLDRDGDLLVGDVVLPAMGGGVVAPDRDGSAFAVLVGEGTLLYDAHALLRWKLEQPSMTKLAWTSDHVPIALGANDTVYALDPADGHVVAERGSWGYGKFRDPIVER